MPVVDELKAALRSEVRNRRRARATPELTDAGHRIALHGAEWVEATASRPSTARDDGKGLIAGYLGVGDEPPTLPLLEALHSAGFGVMLPICEPLRQLSWTRWTPGVRFERSAYAPLQEPVGRRFGADALLDAAALVIPAAAVDFSGHRLGHGGGYYDRFLAELKALGAEPPTAAVVFDDDLLPEDSIPNGPLDRDVPFVITPTGWRTLPSSP